MADEKEKDTKMNLDDIPTVEQYEDYIHKDSKTMFKIHVTASISILEGILISHGLATKEELGKLIDDLTNDIVHKQAVEARETMIKVYQLANEEPDAKDGE